MQKIALTILMTTAAAGTAWPPAGDLEWRWEYTAEALPGESDPWWCGGPGAGTEARVEDEGLRVIDASAQKGSLCRYHRSWRIDPEAGGVVEARVKLMGNDGHAGALILLADGVHEAHLTLYPGRIELGKEGISHPCTTTDGFHVYRLATRGTDACVWFDGELVIDAPGKHSQEAHAHRSWVSFGASSSPSQSEAVYDYVRYVPLGELPLPARVPGTQDVVVYKKPGVYACFPSLYKAEDGSLVTSFGTRVRRSHIDGTGGGAAYTSKDGGYTWQALEGPRPIDPAYRCGDGSLVFADAFGWRQVPAERRKEFESRDITVRDVKPGVVAYLQGARVRRSTDNGETWQQEELTLPAHRSLMTYRRVDRGSFPDGFHAVSIYGQLREQTRTRPFLLRSADDGKSWWFLPIVSAPEIDLDLNETALAMNAAGDLVAMIRTQPPGGGYLHTAVSTDRGITWEPVRKTELWGYPAHLLRLRDGRMLCSYGYRRAPMGIRAALSEDGRSWDPANELILRCDGMHTGSDLGYPISVETEPGKIVTIYYMTNEDGTTHIALTHWHVPE